MQRCRRPGDCAERRRHDLRQHGGHAVHFAGIGAMTIENEFTWRVRWEPGQLILWDNSCTMHDAVNNYHGHRREIHRLIVGPEVPI